MCVAHPYMGVDIVWRLQFCDGKLPTRVYKVCEPSQLDSATFLIGANGDLVHMGVVGFRMPKMVHEEGVWCPFRRLSDLWLWEAVLRPP